MKLSKRNIKRILAGGGLSLLGILLVFFIACILLIYTVITPEKITPVVLKASKEYIRGEVGCEAIDVTFFSVFPDIGIRMKNGSIASGADTLLAFEQFTATIQPLALIARKQIVIHQLTLDNADVYVHIDSTGRVNWDIFSSTDSVKAQDSASPFDMPELDVKQIRLNNVNVTCNDVQHDLFLMADSLHVRLRGNLSKERANLSFGLRTPAITAYYQGQTYVRSLPFSFRTTFVSDQKQKSLAVERGSLTVGTIELGTQGMLQQNSDSAFTAMDIDFRLKASSITDLAAMLPENIPAIPSNLMASGKVEAKGKLSGRWSEHLKPLVTLSFQLTDGVIVDKNVQKPLVDHCDIDFNANLDLSGVQPSSIKLNQLHLQSATSTLTAKGEIDNLLTKPEIKTQAMANIDFTQLSQYIPVEGMTMEGHMDFDLTVQCLLDDILASNYGKINAHGVANIRDVTFYHDAEQLFFYTSNADMRLGINTKDSVSERFPESLLRCRMVLDTLHLNRKEELVANTGRISFLLATAEPKDTTSIVPVTIGSRISMIRLVMGDSIRLRGVQASGNINIRPRAAMPELPEISGSLNIDSLMGRAREMSGRISKATLKFKLDKQPERPRNALSGSRTAEIRTGAQRDSLRQVRSDPTTNLTFQIESQETKDLLRNWELTGGIASDEITLRTPYFPLPIRMIEPDFSFNDNILNLANAHFRAGQSDFTLKGDVEGLRRALLYNGTIRVTMTLDADSLDFNELIRTAAAGSDYTAKTVLEKDSILNAILDENAPFESVNDSVVSGVFVVPRNLDVELNSRIQNARFSNIHIRNARGKIILRDQAIQIPRLRLNTSIGSATMTMIYKAPDLKGAYLGFDLGVRNIDLKELIGALPVFVEMAPMIKSFEGVVDCDMAVVSELDSLMNVRLPATTASCYLSGQHLVLLDGETFAEISKTLMFKNKNKNIIDSMSVEMILEDEKLMIFPFQLSMDRYNVAVGGMHHLDMSFDYHITVLKSPVPFKLGLNISGTPESMKIRPGKAKYKNMFAVAHEKLLDNTTINLRKEMDEKLRESIQDIAGVAPSQPMRRPRMELPDSLKNDIFLLEDTIAVSLTDTIRN